VVSFDRPREVVPVVPLPARSQADEREEVRLRCRVRLLTLAGDLDDLKLRARLNDSATDGPVLLRVWDPARQGPAVTVSCEPGGERGRLGFRYYPSGVFLADAQEALEPGDAVDAARDVAAELAQVSRARRRAQ
jgi:hypothetical protein